MKKKQRNATRAPTVGGSGPIKWQAVLQVLDWALDVANALARDVGEEVAAVERVRAFVRKRIAGEAADVTVDDLTLVFALVIGAVERDLGLYRPRMHLPSASELWERTFPRSFTVHITA